MTVVENNHQTPRRLIVLGASNVAHGLPALLTTALNVWQGPLDFLGACGLGRSYGSRIRVLWRELPAILDCGLWDALARQPSVPSAALVTDIGNDLLYDSPITDIAAWVTTCLDRLQQRGAKVALTSLPLGSVAALSPKRFLLCRSVLFPMCRLSHATLLERGTELDRLLREAARQRGVPVVENRREWYGFDPIHIKRPALPAAWREMLSASWTDAAPPAARPPRTPLSLHLLRAERRWVLGRERLTRQPAGRLADGTTVALY